MLQPSSMPASLSSRLVQKDALILVMPEVHPLVRPGSIALEKFSGERFLSFERHFGPQVFDAIVVTCMRRGFSPRLLLAHQLRTIVSLILSGLGAAPRGCGLPLTHGQTYIDTLAE